MKKIHKIKTIVCNNMWLLSFVFKAIPGYVVMTVLLYVAKAFLQSLSNVWLIEKVINAAVIDNNFQNIVRPVLLFCSYAIVVGVFNALFIEILEKNYRQRFFDSIRLQLFEKAINCDISCYDNTEFYENYVWTAGQIGDQAFGVFQNLASLIQRLFVISSTCALMAEINGSIMLVVAVSCVINFIIINLQKKLQFSYREKVNTISRVLGYVERTIVLPDYAKEIRTSKITKSIKKMFDKSYQDLRVETEKTNKRLWRMDLLKKFFGEDFFSLFLGIVVLSWQVLNRKILIGAFVASYNGIQVVYSSLSFILGHVSSFAESSLYAEKIKVFWEYKPLIANCDGGIEATNIEELKLKNVYFAYEKEKNVINNISLFIKKTQRIAIVGANGSGKTTLVKLILRLYDPIRGDVLIDENIATSINLKSYRKLFSCLFQDNNIYACKISENICMDSVINDETMLDYVSKISGIEGKIEGLRKGYDSFLTREFNDEGVILSGGEKQKLAIARSIYKNAECYILDEPTSALDPEAEADFNKKIMSATQGKMLIIISHRLTTTRFVDKVIVMNNGIIEEFGSHEELMKKGGIYYDLFSAQANQYLKKDSSLKSNNMSYS